MSSVRISHHGQGRPAGLSAMPGGATRDAQAADGARFADALGAAGIARDDANNGSAGSPSGDSANRTTTPRRRSEANDKTGDTAAALVAEGLAGSRAIDVSDPLGATNIGWSTRALDDWQSAARASDAAMQAHAADADTGTESASRSAFPSAARAEPPQGPGGARTNGLPTAFGLADPTASPAGSSGETAAAVARTQPVDDLTAGLIPAEPFPAAVLDATGPSPSMASVAANSSPGPHATPSPPGSLAAFSGSLPPVVAGNSGDPGSGAGDRGDDRGRFTPISVAPTTGDGTVASLGGTGQVPTVAAGPAAAPGMAADAGATSAIRDQVAGAFVRLVSSGPREMVMRLHPAELGDLTVRVAVSGRDVTAWFTSPQPRVQNAISEAIGQLQTGLGSAGYNLSGAWVGADNSGAWQQSAKSSPPPVLPASDLPPSGVANTRPLSSGMSIYV